MNDLDRFIAAYVECALWSSTGDSDIPLEDSYGPEDIAESSLQSIRRDCERFIEQNRAILDCVESKGAHRDTYAHAGYGFWLTRNHHGAGFWDGEWDVDLPFNLQQAGTLLTDAAQAFGESDLYVGDDGRLYVTPER